MNLSLVFSSCTVALRQRAVFAILALTMPFSLMADQPDDADQRKGQTFSYHQLRQLGLEMFWQSQIQTNIEQGDIVEIVLHVHSDLSETYYELTYEQMREQIALTDLNPRGEPFGEEGAKEWVQIRREILQAEGYEVSFERRSVAKTSVVAVTGSGLVQRIDGETGETLWKAQVGERYLTTLGIGMNDRYVVAVREDTVFCLHVADGRVAWERPLHQIATGGVSLSNEHAYVMLFSGDLEMFTLDDIDPLPQIIYTHGGSTYSAPALTPRSVSWATERGALNVTDVDKSTQITYRLNTEFPTVAGSQVVGGDYLILCSHDGEVYCVAEQEGVLLWRFFTGSSISRRPIGVGKNHLLVITDLNELIHLDAHQGQVAEGWPNTVPGIVKYVGASNELFYFLNETNELVGLTRATGSQVLHTPVGTHHRLVSNTLTDRLYFYNESGSLVCLREVASDVPLFHQDALEGDPFENTSDPFADPFGSDDDGNEDYEDSENDVFGIPGDNINSQDSLEDDSEDDDARDPFANPPVEDNDDEADPFEDGDDDSLDSVSPPPSSFDPTDPFDTNVDEEEGDAQQASSEQASSDMDNVTEDDSSVKEAQENDAQENETEEDGAGGGGSF